MRGEGKRGAVSKERGGRNGGWGKQWNRRIELSEGHWQNVGDKGRQDEKETKRARRRRGGKEIKEREERKERKKANTVRKSKGGGERMAKRKRGHRKWKERGKWKEVRGK